MTAASGKGFDGANASAFTGEVEPGADSFFKIKNVIWDKTNTFFVHRIADQDVKELTQTHHQDTNRYDIPADKEADFINYVYGPLPEALTLRPQLNDGCCACCAPVTFHVAKSMFGDPVATVNVHIGQMYLMGCAAADVEVNPMQQGGRQYRGELKKKMCAELCGNETTLTWNAPNKPYMTARGISSLDTCLYQFGVKFWLGWRGSSEAVPQRQALYDQSVTYDCYQQCSYACVMCNMCKDRCCSQDDMAPRFARSEDIRRTVAERYDYELAFNPSVEEGQDVEVGHDEGAEDPSARRKLPRAHLVDAIYTSRLYHDVICGKPNVAWGKLKDGTHEREAAIDVRYRGSRRHRVVTEDDHLIVLASLVMQGLWMFPQQNGMRAGGVAGGGPAALMRGYIAQRLGSMNMDGTYNNNQGV